MKTIIKIALVLLLFALVGCSNNEPTADTNNAKTKSGMSQEVANESKKIVTENEDVKTVHAINTNKKIIIAFDLDHENRLQLADTRKDITKKIKDKYPNYKVHVSTDQKILMETEELEKKIEKKDYSKKKLSKKVDEIIKLSKEQT